MCTLIFLHSNNLSWTTVIVRRENMSTMGKSGWYIFLPYSSCRIKTSTIYFFFHLNLGKYFKSQNNWFVISARDRKSQAPLRWSTWDLRSHSPTPQVPYPEQQPRPSQPFTVIVKGTITQTLALNHLDFEIPVQKTLYQKAAGYFSEPHCPLFCFKCKHISEKCAK